MPADSLTPDDITAEALLAVFNDAYIDATLDNDGDVRIKEDYVVFVRPSGNGRRVCLYVVFGIVENASILDKLELANNINNTLSVVRASVGQNSALILDYYLLTETGISKKAIVRAYRTFVSAVETAIKANSESIA